MKDDPEHWEEEEANEEDSDGSRFPLWEIHDPNLDYLKRPDMTLEEFDQEFPNFEEEGGDWYMLEKPVMLRVLRGYRRLLVEKEERPRES